MKLVLLGYYGAGNQGDEASLQAFITEVRAHYPRVQITVVSHNPAETEMRYKVVAVHKNNIPSVISAIRQSHSLVCAGGSLLQNRTSLRSLLYYLYLIRFASRHRKRVFMVGQGLGPFRGAIWKSVLKQVLSRVTLLSLRDRSSEEFAQTLGIPPTRVLRTADLSLILEGGGGTDLMSLFPPAVSQKGIAIIGVSLRPHADMPVSRVKEIAEILNRFSKTHEVAWALFPMQSDRDSPLLRTFQGHLLGPTVMIETADSVESLMNLMGGCALMIGMRLHALIFSARMMVPLVGLSYDPKVDSFLELVDQPGTSLSPFSKEKFADILNDVWGKREAHHQSLQVTVPHLAGSVRNHLHYLFEQIGLPHRIILGGVEVDAITLPEALSQAELMIREGGPHLIFTPNPEMIVAAQSDPQLKTILAQADLALPDGVGLKWAARLTGQSLPERIGGIDFMAKLLEMAQRDKLRVFLMGSKPGVSDEAAENIQKQYPGISVVGTAHGYFSKEEEGTLIQRIKDARPDLLFVGMGHGKQESWLIDHADVLKFKIGMGIGGSLDVWAGRLKRAPQAAQRLGIEWLFRALQEPTRLPRLLNLPRFLWIARRSRGPQG